MPTILDRLKSIVGHLTSSSTDTRIPKDNISYVEGPSYPPLLEVTLGEFFDSLVDKYGDKQAVVSKHEDNLHWSYNDYRDNVDKLARALYATGIRKGDRVGACLPNNSVYAALQFATAKIGAILTTLNPAYKPIEMENALRLVGCKSLVIVPSIAKSDYLASLRTMLPEIMNGEKNNLKTEKLPDLRQIIMFDNSRGAVRNEVERMQGVTTYEELLMHDDASIDLKKLIKETDRNDACNLQFTSGTTGLPKAVALTHRNLLNNGLLIGQGMRLTPEDIVCVAPPLFHCFGLVLGNLAAFTHASSVVYPNETFDPKATLKALHEEKCTANHGVPTFFIQELNHLGPEYDLSSLRTGIMAGSPCPVEVMKKVIDQMNINEITICYGMTETSPVTFQTMTDDPLDKRVNSVGRVHAHVKAKVIDTEGNIVPIGTAGELCTAGYMLQKGYWGNPTETAKVMIKDEKGVLWMHTGDEAVMDKEGFLRIVGRLKDLVIRGGENLPPLAIENALYEMPQIQDVSVVGAPDPKYGEVVAAWIILKDPKSKPTRQAVRDHVGKAMSHHCIPQYIFFADEEDMVEFPKTASGKIRKVELRDMTKERVEAGKFSRD